MGVANKSWETAGCVATCEVSTFGIDVMFVVGLEVRIWTMCARAAGGFGDAEDRGLGVAVVIVIAN